MKHNRHNHKKVYSMSDAFTFPVKVYYEDTDAGGVVYHANYLKFMERARSELLIEKGFSVVRCEKEFGVLFVVKSMDIDFASSAKLGDDLVIITQVLKLGKVGLVMQQSIYNTGDEQDSMLVCSAKVKLASVKKTDDNGNDKEVVPAYALSAMPVGLSSQLREMII